MRHLLGLEHLTAAEITRLLDAAEGYVGVGRGDVPKRSDLAGKVVANLFYEPCTRTKLSFALAARRLGADTLDFSPGGSSTAKGESFIDTAQNIEAMGIDAVVVRHASAGAPHLLTKHLLPHVRVVNAGDGAHEHPTQGLLDIFTIRRAPGPRRRADGRPRRGHRPQPGGPEQHPRADEAGRDGDRLRPDDARARGRSPRWGWRSPTTWTRSCRGATWSTCCGCSSSGSGPGCSRRSASTPTCSA